MVEYGFNKVELIYLIELLIHSEEDIKVSPIEELPLEMAVIKWCLTDQNPAPQSVIKPNENQTGTVEEKKAPVSGGKATMVESINDEIWMNILTQIKPINASVEALLRAARPVSYDGHTLTLGVYYKFHKERLEDNTHRRVLEDIVTRVLQSPARVVCTLVEPPTRKIVEETKTHTPDVVLTEGKDTDIIKVAEEIFGS